MLVSLAPTPEEVTTVKGYSGDTELLDRASAFYWHVCRVPRFKNRLDCHIISFKYELLLQSLTVVDGRIDGSERWTKFSSSTMSCSPPAETSLVRRFVDS